MRIISLVILRPGYYHREETQYWIGSPWRLWSLLVMFRLLLLWLKILAFLVPGFSNLFSGSTLNALIYTYIVWFISATPCTRSINCILALQLFDDQPQRPWTISISILEMCSYPKKDHPLWLEWYNHIVHTYKTQ